MVMASVSLMTVDCALGSFSWMPDWMYCEVSMKMMRSTIMMSTSDVTLISAMLEYGLRFMAWWSAMRRPKCARDAVPRTDSAAHHGARSVSYTHLTLPTSDLV